MDPPSYFVVCLHRPCTQEAADFIVESLTKPVDKGGAQLIVRQEEMSENPGGLVLHLSATSERLFELAETMDLKKTDFENDVIRPFVASQAELFGQSGLVGPLSISDIHKCILQAMEGVHFEEETKRLPGHPYSSIMKKAPILSAYREAGLLDSFPLHDQEALKRVYTDWKRSKLLSPPVDAIRDYFGENIALYVSFMAFYTMFLVPTALLGLGQFALDKLLGYSYYNTVVFSLLNLVLVTVFLEFWKRRSNSHSYHWGTAGKLRHKRPRPEFRGEWGSNPVTGREEIQYPIGNTVKKMVLVSIPITFVCLAVAFVLMLLSFEADVWMAELLKDEETGEMATDIFSQILSYVPSVIYSVVVLLMNQYYLHLAHHLTEWENHRTQEQFERYVVSKLVLFEFVNSFLALFYIAFYMGDVAMLKSQVFTMLIVQQVVNRVQESLLPFLLRRPSSRRVMNKISKRLDDGIGVEVCQHQEVKGVEQVEKTSLQIPHAMFSLLLEPYESTYDDFVEMWLQFGSVFLFSSIYPLAGFFALANNLVELKLDAFKLCRLTRKPTPRGVRDIGAWYGAFSVTSVISVMTNCALLAMDVDLRLAFDFGLSDLAWCMLFVGLEHVFLAVRVAIAKLIPDVSSEIKRATDKNEFLLKSKKL